MDNEVKTKVCTKCGRELPLEAFSKKANTKDGLQYHCKECQKEASKNRAKSPKKTKKFNLMDFVVGSDEANIIPELEEKYTPRQLIGHLRALGYRGELTWQVKVKL